MSQSVTIKKESISFHTSKGDGEISDKENLIYFIRDVRKKYALEDILQVSILVAVLIACAHLVSKLMED
jgi:hypothetical protein